MFMTDSLKDSIKPSVVNNKPMSNLKSIKLKHVDLDDSLISSNSRHSQNTGFRNLLKKTGNKYLEEARAQQNK